MAKSGFHPSAKASSSIAAIIAMLLLDVPFPFGSDRPAHAQTSGIPVILPTREKVRLDTNHHTETVTASRKPITPVGNVFDPRTDNPVERTLRRARILTGQSKAREALAILEPLAAAEPRNPEVLYTLALAQIAAGSTAEAAATRDRLARIVQASDGRLRDINGRIGNIAPTASSASIPPAVVATRTMSSGTEPSPAAGGNISQQRTQPAADGSSNTRKSPDAREGESRRLPLPRPSASSGELVQRGYARLEAGDEDGAERLFQQAIIAMPSNVDALGGLGIVRLRKGQFRDAEKLLMQASRGDSPQRWEEALNSARFFGNLEEARRLMERGQLRDAEILVRRTQGIVIRESHLADQLLGDIMLRQQRWREAEMEYKKALSKARTEEAATGLSEALTRQGRISEAAEVIRLMGDSPAARQTVARLESQRAKDMMARGDTIGAALAYRSALDANPDDPWARLELARILHGMGQKQEALGVAEPLFRPGVPTDTSIAAALFAETVGRPDEAARILRDIPPRALTADAKALMARVDVENRLIEAEAFLQASNPAAAREKIAGLISRRDISLGTMGRIATILDRSGDTLGAAAVAQNAVRLIQSSPPAPGEVTGIVSILARMGRTQDVNEILSATSQTIATAEDREKWKELVAISGEAMADRLREANQLADAFDILNAAWVHAPNDIRLMAALARLYDSGGMHADASRIWNRLLAVQPNDPGLARSAAISLASAGQPKQAVEILQRLLRSRPRDTDLMYEIARIEIDRGNISAGRRMIAQADAIRYGTTSGQPQAIALPGTGAASGLDPRQMSQVPPRAVPQGPLGPNPFARTQR